MKVTKSIVRTAEAAAMTATLRAEAVSTMSGTVEMGETVEAVAKIASLRAVAVVAVVAMVGPRLRTAILASHKAAAAAAPARAVASLRAAAVGAAAADIQLPTANRAMALTKVH